jgi:putative solute:sodium symporter small subunit
MLGAATDRALTRAHRVARGFPSECSGAFALSEPSKAAARSYAPEQFVRRREEPGAWRREPYAPIPGAGSHAMNPGRRRMQAKAGRHAYWRRNLELISRLMAVWFVVTFVVAFFARDLGFNFFGWPFSFWVGAQGALVVYVLLVWFYAHAMSRLDREHGVAEDE